MDLNEMKNYFGCMPRRSPMMPGYTPRPMYWSPYATPPLATAPISVPPIGGEPGMESAPTTIVPPDFEYEPGAPVQTDINYTQGFLETKIGQYVKIEFLIGTNLLIDREGILTEVGISYIVLRESGTNDLLMCDMYSIKFVRIFDRPDDRPHAQILR